MIRASLPAGAGARVFVLLWSSCGSYSAPISWCPRVCCAAGGKGAGRASARPDTADGERRHIDAQSYPSSSTNMVFTRF